MNCKAQGMVRFFLRFFIIFRINRFQSVNGVKINSKAMERIEGIKRIERGKGIKYDNESIYYIKTYEWKRQPYTNVS